MNEHFFNVSPYVQKYVNVNAALKSSNYVWFILRTLGFIPKGILTYSKIDYVHMIGNCVLVVVVPMHFINISS